MTATKMDLCLRVSKKLPDVSIGDIKNITDSLLNEIITVLSEDQRIEIRGFGCFSIKQRSSRVGRNPRTGEIIPIPEDRIPSFKFSREANKIYKEREESFQHPQK